MRIEVVTPADSELVSLADAKAYLRVDHAADDALIARFIKASIRACEAKTQRTLLTTTLKAWYDASDTAGKGFDALALPVVLPRGPASSVTEVEVFDDGGVATVASADTYRQAGDRLLPRTGFPSLATYRDAMAVTYVAGYSEGNVPDDIIQAVLVTLADLYEHRTTAVVGTVAARIPSAASGLLQSYVNYAFG
ncbi:MAG: head-tail connector protein [Bacteroidota bacterium]